MHIPGFNKGTGEHQTISFESICASRHYIRQKNYKFTLGEKGDKNFGNSLLNRLQNIFCYPTRIDLLKKPCTPEFPLSLPKAS